MQKTSFALSLLLGSSLFAQNGVIVTVAGNGTYGTTGVGGPALNAPMPAGAICVDHADNFYIADRENNRILRVDAVTNILTVIAGNGTASSTGDFGPATQASLNHPTGLAMDASGNLYISEFLGNRVRRIDAATGIITTIAGNGTGDWAGDGGPAVNGSLKYPIGIALDAAGNLYVADVGNERVRRVDATSGILTTVAGNGVNAHSSDGIAAVSASLMTPAGVSIDRQGDLLITEMSANAIRRVSATTGLLSTVGGNGGTDFNGDGVPATSAALGTFLSNIATDAANNLYFADGTGRVRRIDASSGIISTIAGSGVGAHGSVEASGSGGGGAPTNCPSGLGDNGPATIATLDGVFGVAFTSTGKLLMSDYLDCRVRAVQLPSPLLYTGTGLSLAGQTLTATVTPMGGSATPTGTVQFVEYLNLAPGPTLPLASATLNGGVATLDLGSLTAGSHQVMAIYMGDGAYNGSGSAALQVTGSGKLRPTIGANVPYPILISTPATINVFVLGSGATPTGLIQVSEGGTPLASVTLVNGAGPFNFSSSVPGVHQITFQYSGDNAYAQLSSTWSITVLTPSIVTLTADPNPAGPTEVFTLTATVSPSTATGYINFFLAGSPNPTTIGLVSGRATFALSNLPVGTYTFTAAYNGDFVVAASTSSPVTETIATTSLALSTSGSPSTWGQPVALTASITPTAATGLVYFYDGSVALGSAPLNGGIANLTVTQLAPGSHSLLAAYNATGGLGGALSQTVTQVVNKATASVALASSVNPAPAGQSVVFTATISPTPATGSVQFLDGATVLANVTVSAGSASFPITTLSVGSHSITAVYSGDANYNGATSPIVTQTVNKGPSTTTVSVSTGTIVYGQTVNVSASVTPAAATGTVQYLDGANVLISFPVNSGSVQTVTPTNLTVGTHNFTAVYSGDANYAGSTSQIATVTVTKASFTVTLTSSANPSNRGDGVIFTATLSSFLPTGSVQFLDGATVLGTATVNGNFAEFITNGLTAGSHALTAVYSGDANCNPATSAVFTQTVTKAASSVTVTPSSGTIPFGQSVTLTASVVVQPSATGTVQFLDGAAVLGTATLSSGSAALTVANLAGGTHSITAVYSGDSNNLGSTSPAVTVTVTKVASTAGVASSLNPSTSGQAVILTATISPATATGSVQFLDGATVIGTVTLSGGSAAMSTSALATGSHTITAVYGGSANYNGATSGAVTQMVLAVTTTSLSSNKSTAALGQAVTFTATVSPATATGNVQFLDGATAIGGVTLSGGTAALTVSNLAVGGHSVTAVYGGAAGYAASTSAAVSVTIAAGPPAAPSSLTATAASASQINLSWTASTTAGVTYNVYASATAGFTPAPANQIASGVTATTYAQTGLAASTTRYYRVTAANAGGESAASNQANATTQAPPPSCMVAYSVTTQWNVGFGTAITIKNTGTTPINGWHLTWTWAGNQQITQAWNSTFTQSGANATLTNESWNPTIAAGQTISGMGFNASYSGSNPTPTAFFVNGTRCQ